MALPERPPTPHPLLSHHSYPKQTRCDLKFLRGEKETHYVLNILFVGEISGVLRLSPVYDVPQYVGARQNNEPVALRKHVGCVLHCGRDKDVWLAKKEFVWACE